MDSFEYLEACKALIQSLPFKPVVEIISLSSAPASVSRGGLDGGTVYVFLTCGDGEISASSGRLAGTEGYAAFVFARTSLDAKGMSRETVQARREIVRQLSKFRANPKYTMNLPQDISWGELPQQDNKAGESIFYAERISWLQTIALD